MNKTTIFTDGASRGNPGRGGWGSVVIENDMVTELGGREDNTTNNRMELTAAIEGLRAVKGDDQITLNTDSSYVINGITKWVHGWQKNGWMTKAKEEVMNRDLWEELARFKKDITWNYVGGHSGVVGNERCDTIATSFADGEPTDLYKGSLANYPIKGIFDLSQIKEKVSKKSHSKAQAYSYVSLVGGKIETHATWAECKKRVNGIKARFKKAVSLDDEKKIIEEFGN
jgi:ribonuclease HI